MGGEPDRVRVAGARRIARRRRAAPARRRSRRSRSSTRSSRRAGCGSRGAPPTPTVPEAPAVPSPPRHVPVPALPALDRLPPARRRRHRGDGQPRVLAAAPARRAPGVQRGGQQPHRPAARAARRRARRRRRPGRASSGDPVEASGTYLPDEEFVVVNRSQGGVAGDIVVTPLQLDDGRILLVERGFVPARPDRRGGAVRRRSTSSAGCAVAGAAPRPAQRPVGGRPHRGPARRHRPAGAAAPRPTSCRCTSSWRRRTRPRPARSRSRVAVPELSEGPHLSYAVQWFIFSVAVAVGWVLAVRKSISDRANGFATQPPPQRPRQSPQHSRHRPLTTAAAGVDAQVRRPHVDRQVEEGVEERRQLVLARAAAGPPGRSRAAGASAAAPAATPRPTRGGRRTAVGERPPRRAARPAATRRPSSRSPGGCSRPPRRRPRRAAPRSGSRPPIGMLTTLTSRRRRHDAGADAGAEQRAQTVGRRPTGGPRARSPRRATRRRRARRSRTSAAGRAGRPEVHQHDVIVRVRRRRLGDDDAVRRLGRPAVTPGEHRRAARGVDDEPGVDVAGRR